MMQASMSMEEVLQQIQQLIQDPNQAYTKKKVKQSNPELMKNALFYFPSWEHAIESSSQGLASH